MENGIGDQQNEQCSRLFAQGCPGCPRDGQEEGARDGEAHHKDDEVMNVLIVHDAPLAGDISEEQAGEDGDESVGEDLNHVATAVA